MRCTVSFRVVGSLEVPVCPEGGVYRAAVQAVTGSQMRSQTEPGLAGRTCSGEALVWVGATNFPYSHHTVCECERVRRSRRPADLREVACVMCRCARTMTRPSSFTCSAETTDQVSTAALRSEPKRLFLTLRQKPSNGGHTQLNGAPARALTLR